MLRRPLKRWLMRAVVDTNFVVAVMTEDDVNHEDAVRMWALVERAYLPTIAVAELSYFLIKHGLDLSILEYVFSDPKIELVEHTLSDFTFAVRNRHLVKRYDDFNDLLILATALRLGMKLLTYDEKLSELWDRYSR